MNLLVKIALTGAKRLRIAEMVAKGYQNARRDSGECRPNKFDRDLHIDEWTVDGRLVLTAAGDSPARRHVVFLHGGAYVAEAMPFHRRLIERFVRDYGLKVTFVDYPLAPENTAVTTHRILMNAYREIAEKHPGDEFCLFGDSAGGGLALAFLMQLRNKKVAPFPVRTVLASPWLDVTMSNRRIREFVDLDPMLTVEGLVEAGQWYAGDLDPKNPLVSPIHGRLDRLGKILLLVGTHEIFYPDCVHLRDRLLRAPGSSVEFILGEEMFHDWVLAPFRETRPYVDRMAAFLLD